MSDNSSLPISVGVDTSGVEAVFLQLEATAVDLTPAFTRAVKEIRTIMRAQFDSQGAAYGEAWAPRTEATLNIYGVRQDLKGHTKKVKGGSYRTGTLVGDLSGSLKNSLTRAGDPNSVVEIAPEGMVFGSRVKTESGQDLTTLFTQGFSSTSIFGRSKTSYTVPARPIFTQEVMARVQEVIASNIQKEMNKAVKFEEI